MDLEQKLLEYDGRNVDPFREVAELLEESDAGLEEILGLLERPESELQVGASWVLKELVDQGRSLTDDEAARARGLLWAVEEPFARLHLLQLLPTLLGDGSEGPAEIEPELWGACVRDTEADNRFVRAWAFYGLGLVAARDERYRPEAEARLAAAAESETGAVRVRVRRARELLAGG